LPFFQFINFLRENGNSSAQKWYWDEVEWIEDIKNRYKVKDDPYRLTTVLGKKSIVKVYNFLGKNENVMSLNFP
jgi:hypothetical protein